MNKKSIQNIAWSLLYAIWTVGVFLFSSVVLIGIPLYFFASKSLYEWFATPVGLLLLQAIVYIVSVAVLLSPLFVRRISWVKIRQRLGIAEQFRPQMISWAVFAWGLYFIATMVVTALLFALNIPGLNLEQAQNVGFRNLSGGLEYAAAFVLLVVIAPFFEELMFRGYLFGSIRTNMGFWYSAGLTSLVFAALHGQMNVAIDVFILSLFLCYLREKFDSVWAGVLVHSLKNGLAYMILFLLPLYGIHLI